MSTRPNSFFADEDLPAGAVVDGLEPLARDDQRTHDFDVIVVGSGAAGGVAAHVFASAGLEVAICEEGPWIKTREVKEDCHSMFAKAMRLRGMQVLQGRAFMPMLQGRCVGGSTLVNSAIAWRAPDDVIDDWGRRFGLASAIDQRALEPHYDALERDLSVRPVERTVMGTNNQLFIDQAKKFGFEATPMRRYDKGCEGSGSCITACPTGAKQGMSVTYIPWALRSGHARIFTSCRVARIDTKSKTVIARTEHGEQLALRARHAVVVAASTVQSPNILRRSGVRAKALGRHFQAHPGLALGGLFDRPIQMAFGATQGAESLHFRKTERFKLETISLPPDLAAARIPGVGAELTERLSRLGHVAVWAAQVRAEAEGTVSEGWGGVDRVRYTMTENDLRAARKACALIARMMFDAGAKEVWPGVFGVPSVLRSIDDVALLDDAPLEPRSYNFIATHLFGAARMGKEPATSVVAPTFEVHGHPGIFVVDSSVFPTNLGVNPQHTIMAMSRLAAERLSDRILRASHARTAS